MPNAHPESGRLKKQGELCCQSGKQNNQNAGNRGAGDKTELRRVQEETQETQMNRQRVKENRHA